MAATKFWACSVAASSDVLPLPAGTLQKSSQRAHFDTPPKEGGYSVRAVGYVSSFVVPLILSRPLLSRRNLFAPCRRVLRGRIEGCPPVTGLLVQSPCYH